MFRRSARAPSNRPAGTPAGAGFRIVQAAGSASPGGPADDAAEVAAVEVWLLVRDHVGLDVAEGGIGLVLDAVIEGLDDVFLEVRRCGDKP